MVKKIEVEEGIHFIKRYQNRKLYSVNLSRYISLEEIVDIVRNNSEEIKVMDNKTKSDISGQVLLAALFEREKKYAKKNKDLYEHIIEKFDSIGDLL